jgi:hypothetical protein
VGGVAPNSSSGGNDEATHMTDERSRSQARTLADERRLVGLANDTKWTEFFNEIIRLEIPLQIKLLYEEKPTESTRVWIPARNYLDSQFGPNLFVFIEWVKSGNVEELAQIAKRVGLDFVADDDQIIVYGYR